MVLPISEFKWIDPKDFDLNKYNKNSSKSCVLEIDFEYPKELCGFCNDFNLAPNKTEIKKEMLSKYQSMIESRVGNYLIKLDFLYFLSIYHFVLLTVSIFL